MEVALRLKFASLSLGAALPLLFAAGAAQAQSPIRPDGLRGYIGVEYGNTRLYDSAGRSTAQSWGGEAAFDLPLRGSIGAQFDIKATRYDYPAGNQWVGTPTLHLFARNPYGRVGGFVGYSKAGDADVWGAGVEAEAYFTGASIYGALGYAKVNELSDTRLWSGRVEGRMFLTENFRLSANAGYVDADSRNSSDHGYTVGLGGEYRLANMPVSINAGYQHGKLSRSGVKADAFRIGLRWSLSNETLAERDQTGASLSNALDLFGGPLTESLFGASAP
jgi:hypothetical protein